MVIKSICFILYGKFKPTGCVALSKIPPCS
nr:MAG TPA_asm: hypothetical protein [Caudoviricetes sp.]